MGTKEDALSPARRRPPAAAKVIPITFAAGLEAARKREGWSMERMAHELGVTDKMYRRWVQGADPHLSTYDRVCRKLGWPPPAHTVIRAGNGYFPLSRPHQRTPVPSSNQVRWNGLFRATG